jgi:hypothetical protein
MSSVNYRKILNVISVLWLGFTLFACSVSTIGNVDGTTSPHFQKIALPEVNNRAQQLMNRSLTDFVGYFDSDPHYALTYQLSSASRSVLSSAGENSSLDTTKMSVSYSLQDIQTGEVLTDGSIEAFATSGTISSFHGQDISAEFAAERLVKLLAERLYQKLQLYFLSLED